jgi:hypothetical protein
MPAYDRATWTPPTALFELLEEVEDRVSDFSIPMEQISKLFRTDTIEVIEAEGPGDWPPHAPSTIRRWGTHPLLRQSGIFERSIKRDWSSSNAVVLSDAPHAHFAAKGTKVHYTGSQRVNLHQDRRNGVRRRTEAQERRLRQGLVSRLHEPVRTAIYIEEATGEKALDILLDWVIGETE